MKKFFLLFIVISLFAAIYGQAPASFKYQAVARNSSGQLITNTQVTFQIAILKGSISGASVYTESFSPTTNSFGLVNLNIGTGTVLTGNFETIDWGADNYFIKVWLNSVEMGTSQLLSVPYALYSKTAGTATGTVNLSGDQTINGNKTFTGMLTVQTPVNASDAATKAYVDALLGKIEHLESLVGVEKPVTDIDGNSYLTIRIGPQVWMAENLKVTHYLNGDSIPNISDNTGWSNSTTGAYCDYYNSPDNCIVYGRLYNYYAVSDTRNLCPTGWHIPGYDDWTTLFTYLGGEAAPGALKETGTIHWESPNSDASNESGFTAIPGGFRNEYGTFFELGKSASWWSTTEFEPGWYWFQSIPWGITWGRKNMGFSVRCLRD